MHGAADVHARRERAECKYWLRPMRLAYADGLTIRDLAAIKRIIFENRIRMLEV
ncbi:MAG: DUF4160 domain-containing protein [Gemmatimonadaceae bacterium]